MSTVVSLNLHRKNARKQNLLNEPLDISQNKLNALVGKIKYGIHDDQDLDDFEVLFDKIKSVAPNVVESLTVGGRFKSASAVCANLEDKTSASVKYITQLYNNFNNINPLK